jgi:hypothetical protein
MATPTLSKFGVPLEGNKLGILHPKQKYRFRVIFNGLGDNSNLRELTANVVTATRPKYTQDPIELHSYNSTGYIAAKHKWDTIEIEVRDDITNAVISAVGAQIQKQVNHYEQTSAVAGINYKFTAELHSLDGTNNDALEFWYLEGCFLTNVEYPGGDYKDSEASTVKLTLRYDNATNWAGPNTNDGTTVGGNPFPNVASPTGGTTFG